MPDVTLRRHLPAWAAAAVTLLAVGVVVALPPIPQDPAYHAFADASELFGLANFWNVASNIPFLMAGVFGLWTLPKLQPQLAPASYLVFCLGALLVGVGSAYYHYAPTNDTLTWDRIPMTIAFMGLFSLVIEDRVSTRLGRRVLWPLVVTGVGSVLYWDWTELQGRGDLRTYGLVQFLPMVLIPLLLITGKGGGLRASWLWATLGAYGLAKVAEYLDAGIYAANGFISGHSLKHVLGAVAVFWAMRAMHRSRAHHTS